METHYFLYCSLMLGMRFERFATTKLLSFVNLQFSQVSYTLSFRCVYANKSTMSESTSVRVTVFNFIKV